MNSAGLEAKSQRQYVSGQRIERGKGISLARFGMFAGATAYLK
jgi:hypothetical protein